MLFVDVDFPNFTAVSDSELVYLCKDGNNDALMELIFRYMPTIEAKVNVKVFNHSEVEDVKQDVLISFIKAIESYDDDKKILFSTFISTCLDNAILNSIKKMNTKKRQILSQAVRLDGDDVDLDLIDHSNPEQLYIENEDYLNLMSKIEIHLSDLEKDVLFCFLDRKSYDQIAKELEVSSKVIDNAMQRIRRKFKTVFQK